MITPKDIDKMCKMFYNIDGITFVKMFMHFGETENMAEHIWEKYNYYERDIGKLLGSLDTNNLKIICKMINAWTGLKGTKKYKNIKLKGIHRGR